MSDLVALYVGSVDGNDHLSLICKLEKHLQLTVRCESRKDPGCVVVIEQLSTKFQIQLVPELSDSLSDMLRLHGQIFVIVKANFSHFVNLLKL